MLTLWTPYRNWGFGNLRRTLSAMDALRREMDTMLDRTDGDGRAEASDSAWSGWPCCSLRDEGERFVVKAEVPGLSEQEVDVKVTASSVAISGERKAEPLEGYSVHRKERGTFRFSRSFAVPVKIDPNRAEAKIKNGVLELSLPKAAEVQPKQIAVKAS